ncbi:hypothetical protein GGR50DRAFT_218152 [Xylaria sp. CBS 124048]|nr:hypothetical protein GGR50DRAFT_218152 [Xylaria sp. CBS 124048]
MHNIYQNYVTRGSLCIYRGNLYSEMDRFSTSLLLAIGFEVPKFIVIVMSISFGYYTSFSYLFGLVNLIVVFNLQQSPLPVVVRSQTASSPYLHRLRFLERKCQIPSLSGRRICRTLHTY